LTPARSIAYFVITVPPPASSLGEFETLLLMAVLHLTERRREAYGSAVRAEIEARAGRAVPRGSIYVTLDRLEDKGLLTSREGAASPARGHRPKRLFKVTAAGVRAVHASVTAVVRMHRGLEAVLERR
jgi:DNA-binding PadR family transcriptional regulator